MNLKSLIGKLNDSTRGAMEAAAGLCLARTHYDIEVEHFLLKLLDSSDNDAAAIFKHFELDTSRFSGELFRCARPPEVGQRAHARAESDAHQDDDGSLDPRLDRLWRRPSPHRLHHSCS